MTPKSNHTHRLRRPPDWGGFCPGFGPFFPLSLDADLRCEQINLFLHLWIPSFIWKPLCAVTLPRALCGFVALTAFLCPLYGHEDGVINGWASCCSWQGHFSVVLDGGTAAMGQSLSEGLCHRKDTRVLFLSDAVAHSQSGEKMGERQARCAFTVLL